MESLSINFELIEKALAEGMMAAKIRPGKYGGRYLATWYDHRREIAVYGVLPDDDPDTVIGQVIIFGPRRDGQGTRLEAPSAVDILAHCKPDKVFPIGHARHWINEDGTINRSHFDD